MGVKTQSKYQTFYYFYSLFLYKKPYISIHRCKAMSGFSPIVDLFTRKDKRILCHVTKMSGVLTVVKKRKIPPHNDKATYRKTAFPFDIGNPAYRVKNKFYYFVDTKVGQLSFNAIKTPMSTKLLDLILNQEIVRQIIGTFKIRATSEMIMFMLLSLGMGLALGFIIGNFVPMNAPVSG